MVKQFSICNLALFSFTFCNEWISKASIALIRSNLVGFQGFEFRLQEQFQVTRVTGRVRERDYLQVCHGATCSVYTLLRQTPEMSGTQVLKCFCQGRLQAPSFKTFTANQHPYCENPERWLYADSYTASLNETWIWRPVLHETENFTSSNIFMFDLRSTI